MNTVSEIPPKMIYDESLKGRMEPIIKSTRLESNTRTIMVRHIPYYRAAHC